MNEFTIREAVEADVESLFDIRARTRENPIPRASLASMGITPASWAASLRSGVEHTWVCFDGCTPVGFCGADSKTGEVLVVAVLPEFEGQGIGKQLLGRAVTWLRSRGCRRLWLATNPEMAALVDRYEPGHYRLEHLAAIRAPTVVLQGADDPLQPLETARDLASRVPGAELRVIPGMGHDIPPQLASAIADAVVAAASGTAGVTK